MLLRAFDDLFPSRVNELLAFDIAENDLLPEGPYLVSESYCIDPTCDCRRVLLAVRAGDAPPRQVATITYTFEPPDDEPRVLLEPGKPQSEMASPLLELIEDVLAKDRDYRNRLEEHYVACKGPTYAPDRGAADTVRRTGPKVGPNEPCTCGSGKKFKKCCRP